MTMSMMPTTTCLHKLSQVLKKRSMEPVLMWPNTTIVPNVFQEILALTRVWNKRVTVQKSVVIGNLQM